MHFVHRRNGIPDTRHDLRRQLEAQIHALGADVEQQVARRGNRMARSGANLAERMQFRRPRRPKEPVPRVGSKPHDAGEAPFQVAKFHRAQQRGEISAERAQGGAIFGARIKRRDQEDRGASERRRYCLCEGRRSACYSGCVRRIGLHRESTLVWSGCFGIAVGFLQVPAKLITHRGQEFISEVDLVATMTFLSCDDAPNLSAIVSELFSAVKAHFILDFDGRSASTLLVRVEDVVLRLHGHMARVSAV